MIDTFADTIIQPKLSPVFDYEQLDIETRVVIRQRTSEIKTLIKRTAQDIIEIGEKLIEVKAHLQHGNFGAWLSAEFSWNERTAQNFMSVANVFKSETVSDLDIGLKALYLLAAPSTPDEARDEALARAANGEAITYTAAKAIIADYKPGKAPNPAALSNAGDYVDTPVSAWEAYALKMNNGTSDEPTEPRKLIIATGPVVLIPPQTVLAEALPFDGPLDGEDDDMTDELYTSEDEDEDGRGMGDVLHDEVAPHFKDAYEKLVASTVGSTSYELKEVAPAPVVVPISERDDYDSDEWYTPSEYIEAARRVMGRISFDPATSHVAQKTVKATNFCTKQMDGLKHNWYGNVWLNPPYSDTESWIDYLLREWKNGYIARAVVLVNNATETRWFQTLLSKFPVCFPSRRIRFYRDDGKPGDSPRQGQAFFYLAESHEHPAFVTEFSTFGVVLAKVQP